MYGHLITLELRKKARKMVKVRGSARKILQEALDDKHSPLFLSKNITRIESYLNKRGLDVKRDEISSFLAEKKSAIIARKNFSKRTIAEKSAPFNGAPNFFQVCHTDLIVLSKHRSYGSKKRYILVLVDGLSSFTYLEAVGSTKSTVIIDAFKRIFGRSEYLPEKLRTILSDFGVEFVSKAVRAFFGEHGVKVKPTKKRLERNSKGATVCESKNREVRLKLETLIKDNGVSTLEKMLVTVENSINNEPRSLFREHSSVQMLAHDPKYVLLLKASNRIKRRKVLKKNIEKPSVLPMYSIVRIKKNTSKEILGYKESYGVYSESLYIVIGWQNRDFVSHYILGNLYNLERVSSSTFSYDELLLVNISYAKACYIDSISSASILRTDGNLVEFQPKHCSKVYYANKAVFD